MEMGKGKKETDNVNVDKHLEVSQNTIKNIKENYARTERGIVNQLYFKVPHGSTIGYQREKVWEEMFESIIPRKFVIEQSVFIIDSQGNVSKEVDLAIFDETYTPYIFRYGQLKFIPIEAVMVVVECKSTSMNKATLDNWVCSIRKLKTSQESIVRIFDKIACGEANHARTQTATRPLRILCCLNEQKVNNFLAEEEKSPFDVVIRAIDKGKDREEKLEIKWDDSNRNLYDWYESLNHAQGNSPEGDKSAVSGKTLNDYLVHHNGSELSLMTFNLQLNQLLMLINNPILFPHAAYAKMFNKNGNMEEKKNE